VAFFRLIAAKTTKVWATLHRAFPERQILIRDHGRVHCFTLGTVHQLGVVGVVAGCVLWALLATAAYVDKAATLAARETEITRQVSELNGIKGDYQAAFSRLDEFKGTFTSITCEISDIQDSLLRIAQRNAEPSKRSAPDLPKLNPDAGSGCRSSLKAETVAAKPSSSPDTDRIVGSLPAPGAEQEVLKKKVDELQEGLEKLKASHGAFLEHSADITANRYGSLAKTLAKVGVDAQSLVEAEASRHDRSGEKELYGRGGPFIAARFDSSGGMMATPVALFNDRAARLDNLTLALKAVPLAEPLQDYEITSPFGARNDPINAMSGIHEGVDMGAPLGTPVTATGDGRVVTAGWGDRYGYLVEIDHGMGIHTRYAHLSRVLVAVGDRVSRGKPIGLLGETGRTTGPHLHYEVRVDGDPTNPMKFITAGQDVLKIQ
jgi:murein DD-endopeptidase MepM/ murein hydrolase activator NlpD